MDWIDSKWAKTISLLGSAVSLIAVVGSFITIELILKHWELICSLIIFMIFLFLLTLHYFRQKKMRYDRMLSEIERLSNEFEKLKLRGSAKNKLQQDDIERIDLHVAEHWRHIKNISVSLNKLLEKEGFKTLDI